ncbi:16S rRNA (guanine(966)-N(2))-methyltransferase RsmD [Paenibacillus larvae]|jgi:16S rRNA (guanine966-N2)-methyltransferase|uniref:16S rRNA (Guanine(966)-N(2))-methyltransferase RsmD n=3 Tax=Paenibacillus larvae TaxID=1464 RepID=A0AAP5JY32_9BACL|nr:16S rRNA (guanine(966)-N(2))-methyltransferase RsmD [Paenibacillus larvae]AQR76488.1 16S rRNA (guanine(966)-N(2))-methyltransferase RsmD [Paenibacillus larvae subsp. larvae]AQT83682.1 16S rRNA (guanine(966)-N(2))-methyltransferase RsmD [Paenibacillus larvae subsp. pulvifaciens]AQZ48828.1 16S rRNA (guanine(966)-N(2))-methyltransferase RsmD [Paenibacillus larvae subsp. pulvifaciens]AVF22668.1 putative rRNA methyltransferase YlbH [Paenibacillus larvae subsp. larvae]AVF26926.1 putative rRNA met
MRVISGSAKGRPLKAVPGMNTRPTTDKVKEAIFSMIGPYFDGGSVLDLFAGTGGLGIEALSRGMEKGIFVDIEKKSLDTIRHNLEAAKLSDRAEVYRNDAKRALKILAKRNQQFNLVFLDPPYRMKMIRELIGQMEEDQLLCLESTIVVEHDASDKQEEQIGRFCLVKRADYGETAVSIYKVNAV